MEKKDQKSKKKVLWVVTELYYPEETSTGYYLTKIAEGLADKFQVKVLCGQPNYSAKGIIAPKYEIHKNVEIHRAFSTRLNKNFIPFRLINMITLSVSIFLKSLFMFKSEEQVLVVTTPPLLPFITGISAFLKKSKHILLIHDNYPEILIAVNKAKENSILTKLLNKLNYHLLKGSEKIIVVGRDMKKLVAGKLKNNNLEKIEIIPNWAELETVSPGKREENKLIKELGLSDKLILLYAGNMGYPNDIRSFLEVAEDLKNDKTIHFIFLGAGVKRPLLEKTVKSRQLKNITILDPKPRSEQNIFLNACDVAIVSLIKKMWGVSMPSRTYNILAVGKPILALCEEDSEIDLVVKEDRLGWSIPPNDPKQLKETLFEIIRKQNEFNEMGKSARKVAIEKYSLDKALEKYKKILD